MRESLEDLNLKWINNLVSADGVDLDAILPDLRHILREMLRHIDQALPKEVEPD